MNDKAGFRTQYKIFMRIASYLGPRRKRYIIGGMAASLEIALMLIMPHLYEQLVAVVSSGGDGSVIRNVMVLLGILLLLAPVVCLGSYQQYTGAAYATGELLKAVFSHIQKLPVSGAMDRHSGEYILILSNDVERAGYALRGFAITSLFRFTVTFTYSCIFLFIRDWRIGLLSVAYCTLYFYISISQNPKARTLDRKAQEYASGTASFLIETAKGLPVIRVFLLKQQFAQRYQDLCKEIKRLRIRFRTINGMVEGLIHLFQLAAQPVAFLFGIYLVARGEMAIGSLVFLAALSGVMAEAVKSLSSFIAYIQTGLVSGKRVFSLLDTAVEEERTTLREPNLHAELAVVFNDIHFAYPDGKPVLNGFSAQIQRGQVAALVGASGGGKTTLIKLLQDFYSPCSGSIILYDRPLQELSQSDVRNLSAYVPQDSVLFDATIAENIGLGKPTASQTDIENAARKAYIHDFITSLSQGYDTPVGERGSQLSGGQRQRIAIARAMLKDAPLLLLDEATSALDAESEAEVVKALDELMKGRTTLIVAHRQSTIQLADVILEMDQGKIVSPHSVVTSTI